MPGIANTLASDLNGATTDIVTLQATDLLPVARVNETAAHHTTVAEISAYAGANLTTFENGISAPALDISGAVIRVRTDKTPATADAAGNAGDICWDAGFLYVCVATDTWKKVAIATW